MLLAPVLLCRTVVCVLPLAFTKYSHYIYVYIVVCGCSCFKIYIVCFRKNWRLFSALKLYLVARSQQSKIIHSEPRMELFIPVWSINTSKSSWEANSRVAGYKHPAFYEIRNCITVFTWALHLTLSWVKWIQYTISRPIYLKSSLISSSDLRLFPSNGQFSSDSLPKPVYEFLIFHTFYVACSSHSSWLDHLKSSLLCSFLLPTVTCDFRTLKQIGQNTFLTIFNNFRFE
jgi:hypothetical protein